MKGSAGPLFEKNKGFLKDLTDNSLNTTFLRKRLNQYFWDILFKEFPQEKTRWARMSRCCTDVYARSDTQQVVSTWYCNDILCPICQVKKARKQYYYMFLASNDYIADYDWYHVVLTVPSISLDDLVNCYNRLAYSIRKLQQSKLFSCVKGAYKAFEFTLNTKAWTDAYHLFHPHFHMLCAVPKGEKIFSKKELIAQWRKNYGDDTITQISVDACYGDIRRSLAEVCKYTCKFNVQDLEFDNSADLLVAGVLALKGKRTFDTYGFLRPAFAEVKKKYKCDNFAMLADYISQIIHFAKLDDEATASDPVPFEFSQPYFVLCHRYKYSGTNGWELQDPVQFSDYYCNIIKTDLDKSKLPPRPTLADMISLGIVTRIYYKGEKVYNDILLDDRIIKKELGASDPDNWEQLDLYSS